MWAEVLRLLQLREATVPTDPKFPNGFHSAASIHSIRKIVFPFLSNTHHAVKHSSLMQSWALDFLRIYIFDQFQNSIKLGSLPPYQKTSANSNAC